MEKLMGVCPECGDTAGEIGSICEVCMDGVIEVVFDELQELAAQFDQLPAVVIGEGRRRATDIVEHLDSKEVSYNLKMGLDRDGEPLPAYDLMERTEVMVGATLSEGFEMLSDSDGQFDDEAEVSVIFNQSGFNQW